MPRLRGCVVLPRLPGRRSAKGALELHANGVRYVAGARGSAGTLDILFADVARAFFQPAVNSSSCEFRDDTVRLHLRLRRPIAIGKKKATDVQFVTVLSSEDSISLSDTLRRARSMYDPDEINAERRERERRSRVNHLFRDFCKKIQLESAKLEEPCAKIKFEVPKAKSELTFTGRASSSVRRGASITGETHFLPT